MNKLVNNSEAKIMRGNKGSSKTVRGTLASVNDVSKSNTGVQGNKGNWKQ